MHSKQEYPHHQSQQNLSAKQQKDLAKKLVVMDTPGLCDTGMTKEKISTEIAKWYTLLSPGIHAILLVIRGDRFTDEEQFAVDFYMKAFGDNLKDFLIVVFANKDQYAGFELRRAYFPLLVLFRK